MLAKFCPVMSSRFWLACRAEKAVEKGEDFFEDETEKKAEASEVKEPKVETFIDDEDEENE